MIPVPMTVYLLSTPHQGGQDFLTWLVSTNVFNIALVALILGFLIKKFNLFGIFDVQRERIEKDIAAVEAQKAEALRHLEAVKQRTRNLTDEVEEIIRQAQATAESLSAQILEDARVEAGKIIETSKKRVEMEQKAAAKDLEHRLLNDAILDARHELAGMSHEDRRHSVESFIESLPNLKV